MKIQASLLRRIAALLSLALIQASFGPEAWAQLVPQVGALKAPIGSAAAVAGSANSAASTLPSAASLTASPLTDPSALLSAPSAIPFRLAARINARGTAAADPAATVPEATPKDINAVTPPEIPAPPAVAFAIADPSIETGPRTASIGSRMARRVVELKNFFSGHRDTGLSTPTSEPAAVSAPQDAALRTSVAAAPLPANDEVAQRGRDQAPPVPTPQDSKKGGKFASFLKSLRFPKALWILLGNFVLTQIALETLGVAGPQLVKDFAHNWIVSGILSASASLALSFGSLLAPFLNKKFGENKAYLIGLAGRAVGIGVMATLLAYHMLSAGGLTAIFSLDYVFYAANSVTEGTLATRHLGNNLSKLGSYNAFRQFLTETIGLVWPFVAAGAIVLYGYPVTLLTCFALSALTLIGPLVSSVSRRAPVAASGAVSTASTDIPQTMSFKDALRHLWNTPALRASALAYALFNAFTMTIYFLIGPAYGAFAASTAHLSAVSITSIIYGFVAGGGILGSWLLKRVGAKTDGQSDGKSIYIRKIGTGVAMAALSLLVFWSWLWVAPAVTLFVTPALMVVLGLAQQFAINGLMSIIQVVAPDSGKAKTIGLVRAISLVFAALISIAMGVLFNIGAINNVPILSAFLGLNLGLSALAAVGLFLARKLRRSSPIQSTGKP